MRDRTQSKPKSAVPWALIAVVATLAFVAFVRWRYLSVPLERDEGEYAYAGRLILQGIPPYSIAYNMKFPGTYYAYALILALFGHTPWGIHLGLLLVNAATIVLVYAVGRRLAGAAAGASAAVVFGIMSLDRYTFGVFAHATHFVVLAMMAGLLLLLRAQETRRGAAFLWSGVLLGISVLMKQHAVFFLPFAAAAVVFLGVEPDGEGALGAKARRLGLLSLGAAIPLGAVGLLLFAQGVFGRFWFWTFRYASAYVSEISLSSAWSMFSTGFEKATKMSLGFWVLGLFGAVALWTGRWDRRARWFLTGLFVASSLAVCPGFYFRGHYFILVLPAIALLGGVAVATLPRLLERAASPGVARAAAVALLVAVTGIYVGLERDYLFSMSPRELSRRRFAANPFIEAVEIGRYIHDRTDKDDRIAVMGSEPEIYFYADRKGATGYIYTYALVEVQPYAKAMQAEMIREIEAAHPRYLVFALIDLSWLKQPGADDGIVNWGKRYVKQCYDPVGVVDIFSPEESHIVWGDGVRDYEILSKNLVYTFRRKSDAACTVSP